MFDEVFKSIVSDGFLQKVIYDFGNIANSNSQLQIFLNSRLVSVQYSAFLIFTAFGSANDNSIDE